MLVIFVRFAKAKLSSNAADHDAKNINSTDYTVQITFDED